MKSTNQLSNDHKAILRAIDILRGMSQRASQPEGFDAADGAAILDFFRTFADKCHHTKEESVLFPALIQHGMMRQGGPVAVMLSEHDQGREFLKGVSDALEASNREMFAWHAMQYARLLTDHIFKEDNILFPMANDMLSDPEDATILDEFDKIEATMGADTHERFHKLLDQLGSKYLKAVAGGG